MDEMNMNPVEEVTPFRPILPPKAGYVEVLVYGEHVYEKIPSPDDFRTEQEKLKEAETEVYRLSLEQYILDLDYRQSMMELGV